MTFKSVFPGFSGVKGASLVNGAAELGHSAIRGAATGWVSGGVAAAVDGKNVWKGMIRGAKYGAIGGATQAGLNIVTMGTAYVPEREYGSFDKHKPVYRRGTFITRVLAYGGGIALGRNLVTKFTRI